MSQTRENARRTGVAALSHLFCLDLPPYRSAMPRKLVAALVGVAVVAVAVWFFALRKHDNAPATAPTPEAKAKPAAEKDPWLEAQAQPSGDGTAPRGAAPKWSLDIDPEGPLRLEGQVVDADGKGQGGAEVTLASVPPRTLKAEDDGTFAFDKLVGRTYELSATRGDLIGTVTYKLVGGGDPVVIRVGAGAGVDVTVTDEKSQPIANANVSVSEPAKREAATDDKGHALLKGVKPGWVAVDAQAPGYAPGSSYASIGSAGATGKVAITLRRGAGVSGRVVDESGRPLARVHITAGEQNGWSKDHGDQTSDDKGQFAFPALAPGMHTLSAIDGEHAPSQSTPINVKADKPVTGVEIVMKQGGVASGVVVDGDGKAVPYATVRVAGKGADMWRIESRQATTDQKGKFELRGLTRKKLVARAESDTAASKLSDLDLSAKAEQRDLRLVLDVAGAIAGTVVDDNGKPVAEVQVNAVPDILAGGDADSLALAGLSSASTDGAGKFAVRGLPDGAYRLWAARHASGFEDGWGKQSTPAKVGDKNVKIVLAAPGTLVGKLALETGAAPKLAYIEIGQGAATPASPTGAFQIGELAPGPYDLHAWGPEFAEYIKHDVKIEPGKTLDLGTLTVVRGRKLVGKVVDGSGAPVPGAKIKLAEMLFTAADPNDESQGWEDASGIRSSVSDQDGSFSIAGVPQKATTVQADQPDRGRSLAANVPAGTDDPPPITLVLHGYGSIVGKVTMKGEPQAKMTISDSMKGGAAQAGFAQTGADGTFELPKAAEGTHVISAVREAMMSMKATTATVQVTAGQQSTVAIDIPVGTITLSVAIKALPNNEVDAAQVFLIDGTVAVSNAKQLVDGMFQGGMHGMQIWFGPGKPNPSFDELVPGTYTVCSIPVTGNFTDPTFQQRVMENISALKVYCKSAQVVASPNDQTVSQDLPSMTPLPTPKT
jgi:protocatechuate 3,4-dioxygenase beta subunit